MFPVVLYENIVTYVSVSPTEDEEMFIISPSHPNAQGGGKLTPLPTQTDDVPRGQ